MLKMQCKSRLFAGCSLALLALLAAACNTDKGSGQKTGGAQREADGGKDSDAELAEAGAQAMDTASGAAGAEAGTSGAAAGGGGESQAAGASGAAGKAAETGGESGKASAAAGRAGAGGELGEGAEGGRAAVGGAGGGASAPAGSGGASGASGEGGAAGGGGKGGRGGQGGEGGAGAGGGEGGASGGGGDGGAAAGGGEGGEGGGGGSGGGPGEGRCGAGGGVGCTADEFCDFPPEAECGANDRGGRCELRSDFCPAVFAPVCGCDNRTYASECMARSAGVSVKHDELCTPEECEAAGGHPIYGTGAEIPECAPDEQSWTVSGGVDNVVCCRAREPGASCRDNLRCGPGEFCNYGVSAGGQGCDGSIENASGVCEATPIACTREFNPVCGCDHRSFSNACLAHFDGIAILHEGTCTELDCAAVAGRVVYGMGLPPMCASGEDQYTFVVPSSGALPTEGAICCVQSR